jgi:hypothetical protein
VAEKHDGHDDVPPVDFITFVLSLSTQALVHIGVSFPGGPPPDVNLPLAKHTIDLLGILEQKTHGNLTGEEDRILAQVLTDLRLRFVEASKQK